MNRHARRTLMPFWPYRMKADLAAAFCDVPESTFRNYLKAGDIRRGTQHRGNVFWYLDELQEDLDHLRKKQAASGTGNEFSDRLRDVRQAEARQ